MSQYHRIRLFYLRNRIVITTIVLSTVMATILYLQVLMLLAVLEQSRQNHDGIRGISCVLLIHPNDRTKENVTDCIQHNTTSNTRTFNFYDLKESDFAAPNRETKEIEKDMKDNAVPTDHPPKDEQLQTNKARAEDSKVATADEIAVPKDDTLVQTIDKTKNEKGRGDEDRVKTEDTLKQLIERIKKRHANMDSPRSAGHYTGLWR